MSGELVKTVVQRGVALVQLTRPAKHNALLPRALDALAAAAQQCAQTRAVRAVVLAGAGPSFCAGIDLAALATPAARAHVLGRVRAARAQMLRKATGGRALRKVFLF